jgi:hypothetical protein
VRDLTGERDGAIHERNDVQQRLDEERILRTEALAQHVRRHIELAAELTTSQEQLGTALEAVDRANGALAELLAAQNAAIAVALPNAATEFDRRIIAPIRNAEEIVTEALQLQVRLETLIGALTVAPRGSVDENRAASALNEGRNALEACLQRLQVVLPGLSAEIQSLVQDDRAELERAVGGAQRAIQDAKNVAVRQADERVAQVQQQWRSIAHEQRNLRLAAERARDAAIAERDAAIAARDAALPVEAPENL